MIRKHSAKVADITKDGEVWHLVNIGGRWFYNGRKGCDGFYKDAITYILDTSPSYDDLQYFADVFEAKVSRVYTKEWESDSPLVTSKW